MLNDSFDKLLSLKIANKLKLKNYSRCDATEFEY